MDLSAFILHSTHGLKKFEELLREDAYCSVTEALSQTYGVLASPSLETKEDDPPQRDCSTSGKRMNNFNLLQYFQTNISMKGNFYFTG